MALSGEPRITRLIDELVRNGELAYNPDVPVESRSDGVSRFNELLSGTKTLALLPVLTTLVQPGRVQPWLRPHLANALALLPLRTGGVRHTIEFILSVHPSTAQKASSGNSQTVESRGPSISLEALNSASRLISSPPSSLSAEMWFSGIAPQLLSLLDGEGGLEMIKAASFIIGFGILGRKAIGAPGTIGWKTFAEPILSHIDPDIANNNLGTWEMDNERNTAVPLLRPRNIIVTAPKVAQALRRLASLLSSHPNPGLSRRLLDPLTLPLWSLSSWATNDPKGVEDEWRAPARFLLQILLRLTSNGTQLIRIAQNLLYQGNQDSERNFWKYATAPGGGIQIEKWSNHDDAFLSSDEFSVDILDAKADAFTELIRPSKDNDDVPALFLMLCRKWLLAAKDSGILNIVSSGHEVGVEDSVENKLVEAKLMQRMMISLPERLISNSTQIIELANEVLDKSFTSGEDLDSDDTVLVALSLLNMVFTAASFNKQSASSLVNAPIQSTLDQISSGSGSETAVTARNLLLLLRFKAAGIEPSADNSELKKDIEDQKTYSLAISYLRATDSPPPVRAQGLELLSSLMAKNSSVLDIPTTLILLISLLQDDEEYIYLRVIKAFILLSNKHPKTAMRSLLDHYIDPNEEANLDSRLRLGEALLQVVQKAGETFTGDLARQVCEGLLSIAGRRSHRPKNEIKQLKEAKVAKNKNREAEEAWGGSVPQLEEALGAEFDPIIAQIVEGWDSKRGAEDVRLRASALSIFGSAIETSIAGVGSSTISDAVDLSINILAMEPEPEKAILRRAAILLVMSLVRALDKAQDEDRRLGFGFAGQSLEDVLRILTYIQETDGDGLVRQHAIDVGEGLRTWQVKGLLGTREASAMATELERLPGLEIAADMSGARKQKPRIEEVE